MSEILVPSDDKLTKLLHNVEGIAERLEELDGIKEENSSLRESLAQNLARLEKLEDSSTPGPRAWASKYVPTTSERRRMLGEWGRDVYRATYESGYEIRDAGSQAGGVDADGGFLVPDLVAPEIIRIVEKAGIARSLCRVMPMGSDLVKLTSRDNSGTKGIKVLWEGENAAITQHKEEFKKVDLVAKRLAGLDAISDEFDSDAAIDVAGYILEVFAEEIAKEEDKQVFNSTTPFTGILDTVGVGSVDAGASFTNLDYSDVVAVQHKLDASLIDQGTFVFHPSIAEHLRNIKDSNGNPIWSVFAGNQEPTILGRPYRVTTQMPSTDASGAKYLLYGDFKHCVLGIRDGFRIAFSVEGGAGFENMQRLIRVSERIAVAVPTATAFAYAKTT